MKNWKLNPKNYTAVIRNNLYKFLLMKFLIKYSMLNLVFIANI